MAFYATNVSGKRNVYDLSLMNNPDPQAWEQAYNATMDPKYHKHGRNIGTDQHIAPYTGGQSLIYVVPRVRGGSYKEVPLAGVTSDQVYYAPISKGFAMQEVSSFSLGPIVGEGFCLVNAAFSKIITIAHIEGGGKVNLKRKCFWEAARQPQRTVVQVDDKHIAVNNVVYDTRQWLAANEELWRPQWELWRQCVALCSLGDFHWDGGSPTIGYSHHGQYLSFVEWKRQCYIAPSYQLLPYTRVLQCLRQVHRQGIPLGLVHPKGMKHDAEQPLTIADIREMYDSPTIMCCQPYVVAGALLGVPVYPPLRLVIIRK